MRASMALFIIVASVLSLMGVAKADDWIAVRLRGQVLQLVDNQWQPLKRGDVVPDSRVVRTLANGHVAFERGRETVEMSVDTQIRIFDQANKATGKPFTTIKQDFGTVVVEAEVEQVQHFAVQTPYVAAVVKGTRFTVVQGRNSASVSVQRGHVFVEDQGTGDRVTIDVGQSAIVAPQEHVAMAVEGCGTLPVVTDRHGKAVGAGKGNAPGRGGINNLSSKGKGKGYANGAIGKGNAGNNGYHGRGNNGYGGFGGGKGGGFGGGSGGGFSGGFGGGRG